MCQLLLTLVTWFGDFCVMFSHAANFIFHMITHRSLLLWLMLKFVAIKFCLISLTPFAVLDGIDYNMLNIGTNLNCWRATILNQGISLAAKNWCGKLWASQELVW